MTEWDPQAYTRHSGLQDAMADRGLSRLTLAGGERVLDIGCGDGKVTARIAAPLPGGSVLGLDQSSNMVAFATGRFPPNQFPNLRFGVGDARRLDFRAEFDVVVSFNALHWVHEQGQALRGIAAALKPGGRALLRQVGGGPRPSPEIFLEETALSPRWVSFFAGYTRPFVHFTPEEYRALAEAAGLKVLRVEREDHAWDFGGREAFAAFIRGTFGVWTRRVPEDQREAYIADVLDRYRAVAAPGPGEEHTMKFYQLEAELTAPA
jgi:trans-aconitate methyltransferase